MPNFYSAKRGICIFGAFRSVLARGHAVTCKGVLSRFLRCVRRILRRPGEVLIGDLQVALAGEQSAKVGLLWYGGVRQEAVTAQRRHHGGAFKARVAVEAIAGHKTVDEIVRPRSFNPDQGSQIHT